MGLEPTTFCMAIVSAIRINACFCGFRLNPITGDYRGFGRYWSPNGPPDDGERCWRSQSANSAWDHSPAAIESTVVDARMVAPGQSLISMKIRSAIHAARSLPSGSGWFLARRTARTAAFSTKSG
jgi:hypothetical protein